MTILEGKRYLVKTPEGEMVEVDNYQPAGNNPTPAQKFEGVLVSMFAAFDSDVMPEGMFTDPSAGFAGAVDRHFTRKDIKRFLNRLEERRVIRRKVVRGQRFIILRNPPFDPDPNSPFAMVHSL